MMGKSDDKILLKKIRGGDSAACEELFLKYDKRLYNIAYDILKDEMLAEDAVIETFERLIINCQKIHNEESLISWLSITVQRRALNIFKKNKRVSYVSDESLENIIDRNIHSFDNTEKIHIRDCLGCLPEDQYEAFMLKYKGVTLHEICKIMSLSMAKVRGLIKKAKENFIKFYN